MSNNTCTLWQLIKKYMRVIPIFCNFANVKDKKKEYGTRKIYIHARDEGA